jgi:hypothetical protein
MKVLTTKVLLILFCIVASAKAQTWRIGDDQPFPIHISDLSAADRGSILRALEPALRRYAKELDLEPNEIAQAKKDLLLRRINTPMGALLLVQGWGSSMCGATGNCAIWAIGNNDRVVLEAGGYKISVLRSISHGFPSILTSASPQTDGSELVWYSFDGSQYRAVSCATETYGNLTMDTRRRITHHPCDR